MDYIYDDACPFSEGLAAVKKNGAWSFISENGERAINITFDNVAKWPKEPNQCGFSGGVAKVTKGPFEYIIDKNGNCLAGCVMVNGRSFQGNSFTEIVSEEQKHFLKNSDGIKWSVPFKGLYKMEAVKTYVLKKAQKGNRPCFIVD